jgi:hypothetical protein
LADIFEILTIAVIGIATVYVNILVVISMKNQNDIAKEYHEKGYKRDGLMQAFRILSGSDQRNERSRVLELYDDFRLNNDVNVYEAAEEDKRISEKVRADFDTIGTLLKNEALPPQEYLEAFWNITLRCFISLKPLIDHRREERDYANYSMHFQELAKAASDYGFGKERKAWDAIIAEYEIDNINELFRKPESP